MWYIYAKEYYSAVKKENDDIMKSAGEWMELEKNIIPSEYVLGCTNMVHTHS